MKTQNRHFIVILILLLPLLPWGNKAFAVDWAPGTLTSGTYTLTTSGTGFKVNGNNPVYDAIGWVGIDGTVNIVFQNSETILINNKFRVYGNGTLVITNTGGTAIPTLKRGPNNNGEPLFYGSEAGGSIDIRGTVTGSGATADTTYFVIDGGAVYSTPGDARTTCTSTGGKGALVACGNTALTMQYVHLQNGYRDSDNGCAIWLNSTDGIKRNATLTDVKIQGCYAINGGAAMYLVSPDWHNVVCTRVEIFNCLSGQDYTIRANGGTRSNLTLDNCNIHDNMAPAGGGLGWNCSGDGANSKCIIKGNTKIHHNVATATYGGGIVGETNLEIQSAEIYNNTAPSGGGIYLKQWGGSAGAVNGAGFSVSLGADVKIHHNEAIGSGSGGVGGGIYYRLENSDATGFNTSGTPIAAAFELTIEGAEIYENKALHGAGIAMYDPLPKQHYVSGKGWSGEISRSVTITSGEIHDNITMGSGGRGSGIFIQKVENTGYASDYTGNGAGTLTFTASGGEIYNNGLNNSGTVNTEKGCGIYIANDFTTTSYNSECNVTIEGTTQIYANHATYGGGFAVVGGTCNIQSKDVTIGGTTFGGGNFATYGGGIYADGGTTTITAGYIKYNEATQDGGGIYANGGMVTTNYSSTSNGTIDHNFAGKRGGGLFISSTGRLDLKGKTKVTRNRVALGQLGGGVYLEGTVQAGASSSDVIQVADNFASNTQQPSITDAIRSNIYLPNPTDYASGDPMPTTWPGVISVINNGLNLNTSSIGFSVPSNYLPVIYCATPGYLSPTIMESNAIFEDSHRFSKYYSADAPYSPNYIYLFSDSWTSVITKIDSVPYVTVSGYYRRGFYEVDNRIYIYNYQALAWLISYVNGLNGQSPNSLAGKRVFLVEDFDMSAHSWVPIGTSSTPFQGEFDGQGHSIKGIYCDYVGGTTGSNLGMIGVADGAKIHDVFLLDERLMVRNQTSGSYDMGAIAATLQNNGSIYNCTASSTISSTYGGTNIGGLVGNLVSGTIHSSAAMADMTGYTMGGLAGNNAGNIYNSFTNPKFTYNGAANAYFVGGLAASNSGTIQNCYVRFSRESSFSNAAKFGQIVGENANSATVCYNPLNYDSNIPSALVNTGSVTSTVYGDVVAPYLYNHGNDNLVGSTSETLCKKLNDWVTTNNSTSGRPQCVFWKRTTAGGYSSGAGNINGDYPIHKYLYVDNASNRSAYICAASTDGVDLDYHTSLNYMLDRHMTDATINMYASFKDVKKTTGSNVVVYIDEDVALVPHSSSNPSIEAYTCQVIDDTQRSWHFVSSSLSNSGIGFNYGITSQVPFNWTPNPCHVTVSENDDNSLFPSDLPMNDGYSDMTKIDLYTFYEPAYHWVNLKRNSNSHWYMNDETRPIDYNAYGSGTGSLNDTTLISGKGYLISIDQKQLLQNRGTLKNGNVNIALDYTPANAWTELDGYNLIGNPYQSYLSFTEFARINSGLWYDNSKGKAVEPTYAVYDAAAGGYIQYKEGASRGARTASGTLNMHQGFMIRVSSAGQTAQFTNAMRSIEKGDATFRDDQPAYPLINLTVTDSEGAKDFAVLELGRDNDEGAEKLRANDSKGWLYLHYNDNNYSILFRSEVENYQPLWFQAEEAGTFTLSWETANAEFEALTLIDNITGVVTDMLAKESYTFEGDPDQYLSRFKIVIGDYKDVEEQEGSEPVVASSAFAFQMGDELVVKGTGRIEVVDMLGRVIVSRDAACHVSTAGMPAGVYILRLSNGKTVRTQKIVID